MSVFRQVFPKQPSYKQEDLAFELLSKSYDAHNTEADDVCLSELTEVTLTTKNDCLMLKSFSPKDVLLTYGSNNGKRTNKYPSLIVLVYFGILKASTAENIANSGLNYDHLKGIHKR